MENVRTIVLKVGGSLLGWPGLPGALGAYLEGLRSHRVVVVVGGGRVADFLRELDSLYGIGEKRSHGLALRALDLTAHLAAALVPGLAAIERPADLAPAWTAGLTPVLAPRVFVETIDRDAAEPLDQSWEVTTDSIAARLAVFLRADELRLLKSAGPQGALSRSEAISSGLVDSWFARASAPCPVVSIVNLRASPPTAHELRPDGLLGVRSRPDA